MVEPESEETLGWNHSLPTAREWEFLERSNIVADIESVQSDSLFGGIVELNPSSEIERRIEEHVYVGLLYLIDDDSVG